MLQLLNFTGFGLRNTWAVIIRITINLLCLGKYEELLDLSIKDLTNYLPTRGLNTYRRKVELVATAFF